MHQFFTTASFSSMRTTFTLDDDAAQLAQAYARARSLRMGQAVSELIRRASTEPMGTAKRGQAWVFDLPADAPKVTARQVKDWVDEGP